MVLGVRGMPNVQGGVETHAEHLYQCLDKLGCKVEVLIRSPFVSADRQMLGNIRLRRLWSPRKAGFEALIHSILGTLYAGIKRPDILHIHAVGPAIVTPLARLMGLKVVVTHHGPDYDRDKWGRFARLILKRGESNGMRYSHARIAISNVIADLIKRKYHVDADLIPNGVLPASPCVDDNYLHSLGLESGKYFLQVSRLVPEKRQLDLIDAFVSASHSGWRLVLVGGIDDSEYCKDVKMAARRHNVIMTGFLSGEPLKQLYAHAGGFVLPSSHEGLPIAMLEALSYGIPVLASDIPANLEVGLGSESYFPLGNTTVLANRLIELAHESQTEMARVGRRARIQKYDWNVIAEKTLLLYRRVLYRNSTR